MFRKLGLVSAVSITAIGFAAVIYLLNAAATVDGWMVFAALGAVCSGLLLLYVYSSEDEAA